VSLPDKRVDQRLVESVDDDGELLDTASPALAAARQAVQQSRTRLVKRLEGVMRALEPQTSVPDAGVTVRNGRYVIPVRRDSRSRPSGIVHDESSSAGTLFVEPTEVVELGNALREAEAEAEREALRVLRELTRMLRPAREALLDALAMCVAVDDLVARARYAVAAKGEVPTMLPAGGALDVVEARHPLLLAAGVDVVPFSLQLGDGERTLLVSGPNTGGKTVLLKSAALAALLAQSGVVPPVAKGSALPVATRVFTDIGDRQSLAANLSTFSGHVALLKRVLEHADEGSLVLLDEIGSGTDPAEGAALAAAVLVALTSRRALTFATTHLGALKPLAGEVPGIVNGSLQFDTATLSPSYRFRKGVPGRSYGLAIARRLGVDAGVLADAEARVTDEEKRLDLLLARAEERERELEALKATMESMRVDQESLQARLELQRESQAAREKELTKREKDADRRAREEARRYLLDARETVEQAIRSARAATDDAAAREARRTVEDAIRASGAARDATAEAPAPPQSAFEAGQRVRLASGLTGDVIEVREDGRLVVAVGSMRMVAEAAGTEVLGRKEARKEKRVSEIEPGEAALELDLRGLTGDEAEATTIAALDAAVLAEQPYLRIIHGMGTGVVRERVRQVLQRDRRVKKFDYAPRPQGGVGVTIAEFA
jgi:DNA mismatch repair protein MutS2